MHRELQEAWNRLENSLSIQQGVSSLAMGLYLVLAALLGLYLRFLFRRFSVSASDSDGISRVFPLLAVITTAVIATVKSSLALSLGLVGALSIVRFRSAIKEPEELVYLFLCVAVGLALGAELPLLACVLMVVVIVLAALMHLQVRRGRDHNLLLTITGDSDLGLADDNTNVLSTVEEIAGDCTVQRFDIEDGRSQLRLMLRRTDPRRTTELIARLRRQLPDCELSYINVNSSL
jgi:uncharacterized membrane protein YhiD involved in acid resistance